MASLDPETDLNQPVIDTDLPPPRPTTPPVRRGFLRVLAALMIITSLAYGVPYMIDRAGYAWEAGRARASAEALAKLDKSGIIPLSSALFRQATDVISPAVVNIRSFSAVNPGSEEIGSGFVIDRQNGYIVTNEHVIHNSAQIIVRIGRASPVEGQLVGVDERTDLAVIRIKGPLGVQATWGDPTKVDVGDWVLAIGSPFALDRTVTAGIISAMGRHSLVQSDTYEDYIQTDAAINPGNSGGPLINLKGEVIGINTAILNPTREGQGIGMAMSAEVAHKVVEQIIENGKVNRAYVGILGEVLIPALARDSGLPDGTEGVFVGAVWPESPAAKAGLKPGDIIVEIDNKPVSDPKELRTRTFILPVGSQVPIAFYRDKSRQTATVTVDAMPDRLTGQRQSLGIDVVELGQKEGGGLVISRVAADSAAQRASIKPGMRVVMIGRTPVRTRAEFDAALGRFDPIQGVPVGVLTPNGGVQFVNISTIGIPRP